MLQVRRTIVLLISIVLTAAGFTPAAFARSSSTVPAQSASRVTAPAAHSVSAAASSQSLGYWLVASDGGVFSGGDATFHGSTGGIQLHSPIVGIGATRSGNGYWSIASDGGIFAFGDATFHGSTGAMHLNRPIVGMAPTPSGNGYWLVASDGGIFAFGDAAFYGSTGAMHLNRPIVGIASTPSGHGYWLVASDGGIFAFGDAAFHGSTGAIHLNRPIVGMASSTSGHGYRLVASDGGVFSFGDAHFEGSTGGIALNRPIVGMAATASGNGYWFVAADGGVFSFGDAGFFGAAGALSLNSAIVGMVATAPVPVAAPATKLAFTTQPSAATGGLAFGTQPVVTVQDATGATVTGNTSAITLTLTTPGGASFTCTSNPETAVAGVATFAGCKIDLAGAYTLTATDGSLTDAVSSTVTITAGVGARLHFATQPSGAVAGAVLGTQPAVMVEDAGGNPATTNTSSVNLALTTPAGATLTCTTNPKPAVAGVATFAGCNINTSGMYTLTATDGVLTSAVSANVQITTVAAKLAFTVEPSVTAAGNAVFATQPAVTVQDATGHTIIADTSSVTLTLTTPAGATLVCIPNPKAAVAGVATFAGCKIDLHGTYTLTASDGALTTAVSSNVTITTGGASQLAFTTQPSGSTGGLAFATQPVVTVQDAGGNTVTTDSSAVTLAVTTPAGATLTCTPNPKAAVAGVATFAGCNIDKAGSYTLTATDGALTATTSGTLTITVGVATKLGFTTQPSGAVAGVVFGTQPVVSVEDAGGNTIVGNSSSVLLALTTPNGATLVCTANPEGAVAGIATFAGCHVNLTATYTLTATDGAFTAVVSNPLTISPAAPAKVVFTTQPSGSTGGLAFATQPIVTVQDALGNTVTTDSSSVTLTITTPAGATLTCTPNPKAAVAGVATFAGCNIDKAGSYTLTATDGALTSAISSTLTITVGTATKLAVTTQPSASTGGLAFGTQPVVTIEDAGGNPVTTDTSSVSLALTTPGSATFACTTNPKAAVAGVATFAGCKIDLDGTYTLTATDAALTLAISANAVITTGVAAKLAFTTEPSGALGGVVFATQPVVTVQDAGGNTVTTDTTSVSLALTTPAGATLACTTNPKAAVAGVATFAGCNINVANTYTLTASDGALAAAVSSNVVITTGVAAKVAFTTEPTGSTGGSLFGTQPAVSVQDAAGNTVVGDTSSVTLTLTTPAGATLACTANTKAAVAGVATFAGCNIDLAGTYTLTASDGALATAVSSNVVITTGAAAKVAFTTQPSATATGGSAFATQPVVTVEDLGGNRVVGDTSSVLLAITTPAGATLTCTANPKAAVAGVATFAGCNIDHDGTYTLTASDGALLTAVSSNVVISTGVAAKVGFTTQPSGSTGGVAFVTQPVVKVQDAGGNTVTTDSSAVTLTTTTPAGATLTCTNNPQGAVAGVATFAGCKIDVANTYTLTAADGALGSGLSSSFTITVGAATKVAFTPSPSGSTGGVAFATQPVVTVEDLGGNRVVGDTSSVLLAITTPAGATLTCTSANPLAAVAGVATFAGCNIDHAGSYTLTATDGGLAAAVSSNVVITTGVAAKVAFTPSPSGSTGGVAFATQPVVTVEDLGGNRVVGDTSSVLLAITTPGGATLSCTSANPLAAVAGVATFVGCKIDVANTYTLTATDGVLGSGLSSSFTITVGAAAKVAFTPSPSGSTGGVAFATQPVVTVEDLGGNRVVGDTSSVLLAITTPGGATLSCTSANPLAAVAGVATFVGCKVDVANTYTLTATDGVLGSGLSSSFTITVGAAAKVAFTPSPSGSTGGVAFATQPVVTVEDLGGNRVVGDTSSVLLAITTPAGATLTCTSANPLAAVAGVATFAGCSINLEGSYTLTATDGVLGSGLSSSFAITVGPAVALSYLVQPVGSAAGTNFATQPTVRIVDQGGNIVTTDTSSVTLALTVAGGATFGCTTNPLAAIGGVATFSGCHISLAGTYTLTATDGILTTAVSNNVTIS
jgi:hypothetical protein